ncbi:hypothetical protein PBOR_20525 [Paenibacillus borealis]|uniref:Uncharacterized protein n=1 Tax=Paenibacillus borealis TaxID=160799 RepID=A0A089LDX3_PAEBO|nr:hypothetical protein PBOR_20525 [Paenibacillus borealis]
MPFRAAGNRIGSGGFFACIDQLYIHALECNLVCISHRNLRQLSPYEGSASAFCLDSAAGAFGFRRFFCGNSSHYMLHAVKDAAVLEGFEGATNSRKYT